MKKRQKKLSHYMRILHRDIGFFLIGLTVIYCLSGIVLIYRDTDFLKSEKTITSTLPPNLSESELGSALKIRNMKVIEESNSQIVFASGIYNKETGVVKYTKKSLPTVMTKLIDLHKSPSSSPVHIPATIFGVLLLFLAISSFWMMNRKSRIFKRSVCLILAGLACSIILAVI